VDTTFTQHPGSVLPEAADLGSDLDIDLDIDLDRGVEVEVEAMAGEEGVSLRRVSHRGRRAVLTASQRARAREVDAKLAAMDALAARFPTVEAEARWWLRDTLAVDPLTPEDTVTAVEHAWGAAWQIHGALTDPATAVHAAVDGHAGRAGRGYSYGTTSKGIWLLLRDTLATRYGLVTWTEITRLICLGATPELQRSLAWVTTEQAAQNTMQHRRPYPETQNDHDAPRRWCLQAWDEAADQLSRQSQRTAQLWWAHARANHVATTGTHLDLFGNAA